MAKRIDWSRGLRSVFQQAAPGYDPRHIESFIRIQYHTLGHLDRATIRREIKIAVACIQQGGIAQAESCARSFGL